MTTVSSCRLSGCWIKIQHPIPANHDRAHQPMATLDELNGKMGKGTVRLGVPRSNAAWHLRYAHRTPRWTTQWIELPKVRT